MNEFRLLKVTLFNKNKSNTFYNSETHKSSDCIYFVEQRSNNKISLGHLFAVLELISLLIHQNFLEDLPLDKNFSLLTF